MDGLPTSRQIDHLALFKEINEFVSFHDIIEPLSPYSSDYESSSSPEDQSTNLTLPTHTTRVKTRYKHVSNKTLNGQLKDPSEGKLFQMLARGNRKKSRDPSSSSSSSSCERDSTVNEDSIERSEIKLNSKKGESRMRGKHHQQQHLQVNDFALHPCATSSLHQQQLELQQQQQHAINRKSTLVKLNALQISDRGSYFNNLDKGLSKYPNYFDYVDNIKKPFKSIEDMPCVPSSSNSLDNVGNEFDCTISPPSPDLNPDILSALNSCLF